MIPVFAPTLFMPKASASYTGPGDIVSGAYAWWGFRAYSLASIGNDVVDIKRASDSTTQTFVSLSTGKLDTASIATFLSATTGVITKLYDQTGNGNHLIGSSGTAPAYNASGLNSLPTMVFTSANTDILQVSGSTSGINQSFTVAAVSETTTSPGSCALFGDSGGSFVIGYGNSANQFFAYASGSGTVTASDNAAHSYIVLFGSGYVINVDGTETGESLGGDGGGSGHLTLGNVSGFGSHPFNGYFSEAGIWTSGFSSGQRTSMSTNMTTFWGT